MADVNITINGRSYEIGCDPGQEGRIVDLAGYIDQRLQMIAKSGAAYNDAHLMVLTALVLADEVFEAHENPKKSGRQAASASSAQDDQLVASLLEKLTKRIDGIAAKVHTA